MKGEKGFTLIEMMIVLLIISVLVLIALPNVMKHAEKIDEMGCDAYISMVQGQVAAYMMENHELPESVSDLIPDLLPDPAEEAIEAKCPDGTEIEIDSNGIVSRKDESK
ncbi:competence type IV pilus major pilin ComGC [Sporosarcina thermotolerans]|uniref:ComG operon protein 3 n=1 Tax=Sporosarcina thermotolerans TaxID=633404 RepID=A0AAW9ABF8_9BACL|nr:competence type IV pilus major pilin ComGC [Sporosarcina thermotolerans]MDW0117340.1 competence type IV pilus major pilin ComGC [Sporosarcina thermotolerans]WHT49949.1 competence type IV pilus major pilin ComGC [Sporosarcina thermotolerans]